MNCLPVPHVGLLRDVGSWVSNLLRSALFVQSYLLLRPLCVSSDVPGAAPNESVTSQLDHEGEREAADDDDEETEDECADQHIGTDSDDSDDECNDDPPASTPSVTLGTPTGVQEPRGQDVGGAREEKRQVLEVATQESSPNVDEGTSDRGLAPVKTEFHPLLCATPGSIPFAPSTAAIGSGSLRSTVGGGGARSPPSLNAASVVKNEGSLSLPRTAVFPEAPESPAVSPSTRVRYTHQLFCPCKLYRWECCRRQLSAVEHLSHLVLCR